MSIEEQVIDKMILDYTKKIEDTYNQFNSDFDHAIEQLKEQIEITKKHLNEAVDRCCSQGLPPVIPEQIIEMMDLELQQYCDECDRVIGQEITKLQKYNIVKADDFITVKQPNLQIDDHGVSTELFETALSQTERLCSLLGVNITENTC
ncbi:hypothetical protein EHI8A_102560 [Entamoeba histolytica HM-1:IMSS-B]|uniref:Uncharacterized protein n=6 Tax=Entamoeba histolytica TaxID=5759 RepID=C4LWJ5_ENTH1|nr:hypothetical protein EHI_069050 [Entamoeba histolytica HM-1:IMSS]EMD46359.1 Hypothetical protein EHI5A_114630 [Entamoeba histolytica KU27]EMH74602.1 hypothetical protein EHI8A_102560 [Entamoeba histolytica HM-1:IMSS-B]ENY65988.1 hypothetical protein EHI7A_097030 [Entamoeba histolytica HM-1:IMSS-A]GAT93083.1 hypothetical protein CL6EHI_069050 [Entamoeba histolytica]EAL49890.1 hypothetical protein EHI_069050 [Entamoeba histolytica HM-1:IMSS]|eukprot:XP_655278.1 hypothetical protein EHI_069050 [Entamoeba histolytica HM-1:IMSS]